MRCSENLNWMDWCKMCTRDREAKRYEAKRYANGTVTRMLNAVLMHGLYAHYEVRRIHVWKTWYRDARHVDPIFGEEIVGAHHARVKGTIRFATHLVAMLDLDRAAFLVIGTVVA